MLNRTRIIMVNTSHPGNIGAAARAMKTMGLTRLYLVAPQFFPHAKALEMAADAKDILDSAVVVDTLDEAIADCTLVIGTSARMRTLPWPLLTPPEMAQRVKLESPSSETAILFGREQSGLTNEELHRCHLHIHIPANPAYSSLNIAAAIQVVTYELRMASLTGTETVDEPEASLATADDMERYFAHLEEVLVQIQFLKMSAPRKLMARFRRLFFRARPDVVEINILRGMLTSIQEALGHK